MIKVNKHNKHTWNGNRDENGDGLWLVEKEWFESADEPCTICDEGEFHDGDDLIDCSCSVYWWWGLE